MVILSATTPSIHMEDSENGLRHRRVQIVLSISGTVELLKHLEYILEAIEPEEKSYQRLAALVKESDHKPQPAFSGGLSEREVEVLEQVAHGASNKQIAASLGICESTVKTHVTRIFQKLDANDRTNAVIKALRLGIINL